MTGISLVPHVVDCLAGIQGRNHFLTGLLVPDKSVQMLYKRYAPHIVFHCLCYLCCTYKCVLLWKHFCLFGNGRSITSLCISLRSIPIKFARNIMAPYSSSKFTPFMIVGMLVFLNAFHQFLL